MSTPVTGAASDYFGGMAESYDSLIRRAVPRYTEMTERLIGALPTGERSPRRILELGCGTGNLTLRLVAEYPQALITAVDASPDMTSLTTARLKQNGAEQRPQFRAVTARFEDLTFNPGSFDLVTSCISLHHVADKAALFASIRAWLTPGATFRFADQLAGATDENHRVIWEAWLAHCREPGHCTEEEVRSLLDHASAHDHYESVERHFEYLSRAGFAARSIDCSWRNLMWAVVTADA